MPGQGNRNTQVRENLKLYIESVNAKIADSEELQERYAGFINALKRLNELTDLLYRRDEDGKYPPFTEEAKNALLAAYNEAISQVRRLNSGLEQLPELKKLTDDVQSLMEKDVSSITGLRAQDNISLAEMIDKSRTVRVDANDKKFNVVGNASSSRKAMTVVIDGKERKGFFTKEEKLHYEDKGIFEQFSLFMEGLPLSEDEIELNKYVMQWAIDTGYAWYIWVGAATEPMFNVAKKYMSEHGFFNGDEKKIEAFALKVVDTIGEFSETEEYHITAVGAGRQTQEEITLFGQYTHMLNAIRETSVSGRNVAMSKVANLFGMPELVARSEMLEMTDDEGHITKGIFMENAKGFDLDKITTKDIPNFEPETGIAPSAIKSLAQLQILDYICGNVDRHGNNFFYIFNEDGSQIIGIQGIDNDFSFGTKKKEGEEVLDSRGKGGNDIPLSDLKIIPKELKDILFAMDDEMLKFTLRGTGLQEEEIQAAIYRMNQVREQIMLRKITVVKEEEWKDYNLGELAKGTAIHSLFGVMNQVSLGIKGKARDNDNKKRLEDFEIKLGNKKPFTFEKVEEINGINKASIKKDINKTADFIDQIAASQKKIWGKGSQEFQELMEAIKEYNNLIKGLGDDYLSPEYLQAQMKLEKIGELAQKYLDTKEGKKLNKNGQERYTLAQEIKAFSDRRLPEFKNELHHRQEIEAEDLAAGMNADINKELEASYKEFASEFTESIPRDNSALSKFARDSVQKSYDLLLMYAGKENLTEEESRRARDCMATILAYDTMIAERISVRNNGMEMPGPIEQHFNEETTRTGSFDNSMKAEILDNDEFQKSTSNITPKGIRKFIAGGNHKMRAEIQAGERKAGDALRQQIRDAKKAAPEENPAIEPNLQKKATEVSK